MHIENTMFKNNKRGKSQYEMGIGEWNRWGQGDREWGGGVQCIGEWEGNIVFWVAGQVLALGQEESGCSWWQGCTGHHSSCGLSNDLLTHAASEKWWEETDWGLSGRRNRNVCNLHCHMWWEVCWFDLPFPKPYLSDRTQHYTAPEATSPSSMRGVPGALAGW